MEITLLSITPESEKIIESAGRTCYLSSDKKTNNSCVKFIKMIIKSGHHSVLEHAMATFRIKGVSRSLTHQLVRHRLCSFSQQCVTGDSIVRKWGNNKKNITIKQLYERQEFGTSYDKTHNKTLSLRSVTKSGQIIANKFKQIFYNGIHEVYEVTTKLGYKLKCTKNHKFLKNKKYVKLSSLNVGDFIMVNGNNILTVDTSVIVNMYLVQKLSPMLIAEQIGISYRTVIKYLKKAKVFVARKNDTNLNKYNKNHTKESYIKGAKKRKQLFKEGKLIIWNKGIIGENSHNYGKVASEETKQKIRESKLGNKNPSWKGGPKSRNLARLLKQDVKYCELCNDKESADLEVHHIDGDPSNNLEDNIIKVCVLCHNLLHHGWHIAKKLIKDKIISIKYIGREDVYDIEMLSPYNNYIVDGFVTHNSQRYVSENEFDYVIPESIYNNVNKDNSEHILIYKTIMNQINKAYIKLKNLGVPKEDARFVLPNACESEIVVSANFRQWRSVIELRCAKKAQWEIRAVAYKILNILYENAPVIFEDLYSKFIENKSLNTTENKGIVKVNKGFYFYSETWSEVSGPYNTEEECKEAMKQYGEYLLTRDGEKLMRIKKFKNIFD